MKRLRGPAQSFPEGRPRPNPLPVTDFWGGLTKGRAGKERDTDCIADRDAQSELDSLQAKAGRGASLPKVFGLGVADCASR